MECYIEESNNTSTRVGLLEATKQLTNPLLDCVAMHKRFGAKSVITLEEASQNAKHGG